MHILSFGFPLAECLYFNEVYALHSFELFSYQDTLI